MWQFWGWRDDTETVTLYVSGDVSEGNAYAQMAEKYEEETGTHVEVTDVPYADLITKISTAVQSDDAPDVARVSGVVPDWADYLMDLSDIADSAKTIESVTIKNEEDIVKAIPTDITAVGMFINTELYDEAGVGTLCLSTEYSSRKSDASELWIRVEQSRFFPLLW